MEIEDFIPRYPAISYSGFYNDIYRQKEFYDLKLSETESPPSEEGETLYKHQRIISRFLSSHTTYDGILLDHAVGSGKSCTAFGTTEHLLSEGSTINHVLVLARGQSIIDNLIKELVFKCSTKGKYVPENYDKLTDNERKRRMKKLFSPYYSFRTFETFAKYVKGLSEETIREDFSNHVVIIDEIHNIRLKAVETEGLNIYKEINRFLHIIENSKKILMSGTPMKDTPEEIAPILNLLLPLDKQMPTGKEFVDEFLDGTTVKNVNRLKSYMKGYVSYLRPMISTVEKQYMGGKYGKLKYFTVYGEEMDDFQSENYLEAWRRDKGEDKGIYSNSRQASLFVFPDKKWGEEGFNKYVIKKELKKKTISGKSKKVYQYSLNKEWVNKLTGSNEEKLKTIEKYSIVYANTIRDIVNPENRDKVFFVYNEFVHGSGVILFSQLLKLFGMTEASGEEREKGERFVVITANLSARRIEKVISKANSPDNMNGNYIRVIIGSSVISEGITLKNIQRIHIQTPFWNNSETEQAEARGIRVGSHDDLIRAGITPTVTIFRHTPLPKSGILDSISLTMYEISEEKDVAIKAVERVMKESSVDCALTFDRNMVEGKDNLRECEYLPCEYKCDGIPNMDVPITMKLTYNLFYSNKSVREIIERLKSLYRTNFIMTLDEIIELFKDKTLYEILTALRTMINQYIPIRDKYGYTSYLKEENNVYFLVDRLMGDTSVLNEVYTRLPVTETNRSYKVVTSNLYLEKISKAETYEEFSKVAKLLDEEVSSMLKENAKSANNRVAQFAKKFYGEEEKIEETGEIDTSYGFFMKYDPEQETFRIVDIRGEDVMDVRKKKTGQICSTMYFDKLLDVVHHIKLGYDKEKFKNVSDVQLDEMMRKNEDIKKFLTKYIS